MLRMLAKEVARHRAEVGGSDKGKVDEAWDFLQAHGADAPDAQDDELKAIRRKVDWAILPLLFVAYMLQFVDKALINYAAVMGFREDLKLRGNDFSNAATAFWIAYLVAEAPNSYFLQKVPVAKWFGANMVAWGGITAAIAGVKNYRGLLAARIILGLTEATIVPSLLLISSQWYTKSEQATRFACWIAGVGAGQILGGLASYGFQQIHGASLASWQIMFLVLGLVSAAAGVAILFLLPDTPMGAWFLTVDEKISLLKHVSVNKTGIRNRHVQWSQVRELFRDPQMWLFMLIIMLQSESSGLVSFYSSTLIKEMGFPPDRATLLNAPSGIVTIFFVFLVAVVVRRTSNRWAWIIVCCVPSIIGASLMSFLDKRNKAGTVAGIYLINAIIGTFPVLSNWLTSNIAGHTKRAWATSLYAMSFSVGNIIGPQTFQHRDAPEYHPAKIAVLVTQTSSVVAVAALFLYYRWENKRRDAETPDTEAGPEPSSGIEDWAGLTDKENRSFRYVY